MLQTKEFIALVEEKVKKTILKQYGTKIEDLEVIQVWYTKVVQNHKGMFIVRDNYGVMYPYFIEATCNGDKNEVYLDYYVKKHKQTIHY